MPDTTTEPRTPPATGGLEEAAPASGWRRLGWFVALWCASLGVWLAFAYGLRWVMRQVGIAG
jgi:hypothetical protein